MVPCSWNSREVDLFDTPFSGFYTTPPRSKDTAETNFGQMLFFLNKSGFGGSDRCQESGSACRLWMDRSRSSEEFYSPDWKPVPIMVYIFQISKKYFFKVRFPIFWERFWLQKCAFALASNHTCDTTFHSLPRASPARNLAKITGFITLGHNFKSSSTLNFPITTEYMYSVCIQQLNTNWIQTEYKTEYITKTCP